MWPIIIRKTKIANDYDHIFGVFWDKKNHVWYICFWRSAYSIELPQKKEEDATIEIKIKGETIHKQKILGMKLDIGDNKAQESMSEKDFNFTYMPPNDPKTKVVLVPKEKLLRVENTALSFVTREMIDRAAAHGFVLHGWTGKMCPECKGTGERCGNVNPGFDNEACNSCAGTGDEYGELKTK